MDIILLATVLTALLIAGVINFEIVRRYIERKQREFISLAVSFISPSDGGPSALAGAVEVAAGTVGRAVAASLKASLMGTDSSLAKAERTFQKAALQDSSPLAAAVMTAFPHIGRWMGKNPQLAGIMAEKLQSAMAGAGSKPGNGHEQLPMDEILRMSEVH